MSMSSYLLKNRQNNEFVIHRNIDAYMCVCMYVMYTYSISI